MSHISHLEKTIKTLVSSKNPIIYPKIFEYYSAIKLTNMLKTPFFVYQDFPSCKKIKNNFPVRDKGIDLINTSLNIIGQCKYYSSKTTITYGKLSTFLASDKLVGKNLKYYLLRTDDCKIDSFVKNMIDREEIYDVKIYKQEFLEYLKIII